MYVKTKWPLHDYVPNSNLIGVQAAQPLFKYSRAAFKTARDSIDSAST